MNVVKEIVSYENGLSQLREQLKAALPSHVLNSFDTDALQLEKGINKIIKLKPGDKAIDFTLKNAVGKTVNLNKLLQTDKVILVFYRGTWCPYCNLQLSQYQQILDKITELGATLVAISPQTPDQSLSIKEKNNLAFEVLSDPGNVVARKYTSVFKNGNKPVETMKELGLDFDSYYGDDSREIPVPAVFIIDTNGTVIFAKSEGGDYRKRMEPADILEALKK